jgi:DNA-binding NarL/FixJ family response regulator
MEIVGEAGNGQEAIELAEKLQPDVVVMDIAMPELNGIEPTRRVLNSSPRTRVLALSMHKDSAYVREVLRAGARGYLLKDSVDHDLVNAVRAGRRLSQPGRFRGSVERLPAASERSPGSAHHTRARGASAHRRRQDEQRDRDRAEIERLYGRRASQPRNGEAESP